MSNRTVAALPAHYRRHNFYVAKRALKARGSEAMRATVRRALDGLRHGGDPEGTVFPVRSREVVDRWSFD